MKITDSMQCDIWYQALLERAGGIHRRFFRRRENHRRILYLGLSGAKTPAGKTSNFIMTLNPRWMPASGHAKSVARRRMPGRPPAFVEQALRLLREAPKVRLSDSELRQHDISPERVRRWFLQNHGITFQAFQRMQRLNMALPGIKSRPLNYRCRFR